ncbi:MAG: COX15/CtaA family protein [Motiliproteus sp.]
MEVIWSGQRGRLPDTENHGVGHTDAEKYGTEKHSANNHRAYHFQSVLLLTRIAILLSLVVIFLGGWTRLNDAGLSCPDWPGCYGELILPSSEAGQAIAQSRFEQLPLDLSRGWLEMGHRYLAATLGLLVAVLALLGWRNRRGGQVEQGARDQYNYPWRLSLILLGLVCLQALFGMWTVTLKLLPQVVTLHLLGGLLTLTLLMRLHQQLRRYLQQPLNHQLRNFQSRSQQSQSQQSPRNYHSRIRRMVLLAGGLLFIQIALGGWTSSNYAGWSCSYWLSCEQNSVVALDFSEGFSLPPLVVQSQGKSYLGGKLGREARAAIQMSHRAMALLLSGYLLVLALLLMARRRYRNTALLMLVILASQLVLGVFNVQLGLPLSLAFSHHTGAVLLLMSVVRLFGLTDDQVNITEHKQSHR